MNAKHTPGPWTAAGATIYAGDKKIATNHADDFRDLGPDQDHATVPMPETIEEAWANTQLQAAAPDLIAALRTIANVLTDPRWDDGRADGPRAMLDYCITVARSAIARAEGTN